MTLFFSKILQTPSSGTKDSMIKFFRYKHYFKLTVSYSNNLFLLTGMFINVHSSIWTISPTYLCSIWTQTCSWDTKHLRAIIMQNTSQVHTSIIRKSFHAAMPMKFYRPTDTMEFAEIGRREIKMFCTTIWSSCTDNSWICRPPWLAYLHVPSSLAYLHQPP